MKDDDFVPQSIPTGRSKSQDSTPPVHPLFVVPPRVEINMVRTNPQKSIYDWVPGFRGTRLQIEGGKGGHVELSGPATLLELLSGGRLTGAAEEDARNLSEIAFEYLHAIAASERATKEKLKGHLETIEKKKSTVAQVKEELGLTSPLEEGQVLMADPESLVIQEVLLEGPEPEPLRKEFSEAELDAALDQASASEGIVGNMFPEFDFGKEPEPPPAPKKKRGRPRKKKS